MQMTPVTSDMTDKQAAFVSALLQGHSIPKAGEIAGYSHPSGAYQAVSSRTVQDALRRFRQRAINTEGASLGYRTMIELCADDQPASVRFQAAKFLMVAGGAGKADEDDDNAIGEMSEQELERLVQKLEENARRGGELPVIRARPEPNGMPDGSPTGAQETGTGTGTEE